MLFQCRKNMKEKKRVLFQGLKSKNVNWKK